MLQQARVSTRVPAQDLERRDRGGRRQLSEQGGAGERGAWFKDGEGNLLAIGQPI
jgi:hypothetical protein